MKLYLRERDRDFETELTIFEGDIEKDRKHWESFGYKVRYFKLIESR